MIEFIVGLIIGWVLGSCIMWFYFHMVGLIRTRDEYYKAFPEEKPE